MSLNQVVNIADNKVSDTKVDDNINEENNANTENKVVNKLPPIFIEGTKKFMQTLSTVNINPLLKNLQKKKYTLDKNILVLLDGQYNKVDYIPG
jgi:hypothetical protein